jgi:S1-C subfamily serine protease
VAQRGPLSAEERNTIRRFKEARGSVVYVSAIAPFQNLRTLDITNLPTGAGTGFVWDDYGHVVTNLHVITVEEQGRRIGEAPELQVTLTGGKTYKGKLIGRSFAYDVAVLQVFAPLDAMNPIRVGSSHDLEVGQNVTAIGNPFGLDHTLTKGIISALGREITTDYQTRILDAIQTDAAVNPGNSGGPLLDSAGRLIGMTTAIVATKGEGSVGVGFAIPVDTLNRVVPRLIAKGTLEPPRMGFVALDAYRAQQLFGITRGLVVGQVDPDTPAARAGMRGLVLDDKGEIKGLGDVILGYQGRAVENEGQLMAMLEVEPPKDQVVLDVLRDGKVIQLKLDLKARKPLPTRI